VTGLRREDMHLVPDATALGCLFPGAHLHVRRRDNPNGAWAKSRRSRPVPVDELLVLAYDTYWFERDAEAEHSAGGPVLAARAYRRSHSSRCPSSWVPQMM
jgi:hypothetical protein